MGVLRMIDPGQLRKRGLQCLDFELPLALRIPIEPGANRLVEILINAFRVGRPADGNVLDAAPPPHGQQSLQAQPPSS